MLDTSAIRSLRQFGTLICVVLSVLFFSTSLNQVILVSVATLTLSITIIRPQLLKWPYKYWMLLGRNMGLIISPVVLGAIFFIVVFPTSILARFFRAQVVQTKYDNSTASYWHNRHNTTINMRDQF